MMLDFDVNGDRVSVDCAQDAMLIDVLREDLGLTGAKRSCDMQICGACTVLVDDEPVSSCTTLAYDVAQKSVETIEGMDEGGVLSELQQRFLDAGALQCGFCTPGIVMTVESLLRENPRPTREDVVHQLDGSLCRCTGYVSIIEAVSQVARASANKESKD